MNRNGRYKIVRQADACNLRRCATNTFPCARHALNSR